MSIRYPKNPIRLYGPIIPITYSLACRVIDMMQDLGRRILLCAFVKSSQVDL